MKRLLSLIVMMCCLCAVDAKVRLSLPDDDIISDSIINNDSIIAANYADSIAIYRHKIDSLQKIMGTPQSKYWQLFVPLNFSRQFASHRFSIDGFTDNQVNTAVDDALWNIYVNHPEFVAPPLAKGKTKEKEEKKEDKAVKPVQTQIPTIDIPDGPDVSTMQLRDPSLYISRPNFWKFSGDYYFQLMQTHYSDNWYQNFESNYSVLGKATLQYNYNNKQKVKFDNKLEMNLGFQTNESDTVHHVRTSSDLLRLTSNLSFQATKKWYYSVQAVASTQFMRNFAANSNNVNSDFLSPFTLNVSVGMDYQISWFKGKLTGKAHFAPFAMNYKYVDRKNLAPRHGIEQGKRSKLDYGSNVTIDTNVKFSDNIKWKSRIYVYTPYDRTEVQWENTIDFKISKIITASLYLYPRYDDSSVQRKDDTLGYFQLKEYLSLGFTYSM